MVTKKLSAVDRLTLATGAVEKINDLLTGKRKKAVEEIEKSLDLNPSYEEEINEIKKLSSEISDLEIQKINIESKISTAKDRWKKLIKSNNYSWNLECKKEIGIERVKSNYVEEELKKRNIQQPFTEYQMKSLINKGQSLALLSENQDPNFVDEMLMKELIKQ